MRNVCVILLSLFFCTPIFSQIDGAWQGVLMQKNENGTTSNFSIWVKLESGDNKLSGMLRSEQVPPPYYKISEVICERDGENVLLEEKTILKHETQPGLKWCLIKAQLKYDEVKDQLTGSYLSKNEWCVGGELVLIKSNKKFNESKTEIVERTTLDEVKALLLNKVSVQGKQFVLKDVHFFSGKHKLAANSNALLDEVVSILKQHENIIIHLKGHTDSDGDDETNFLLSQKRAKSVANYLIKNGVDSQRITYEGHGEARPLVKNDTQENKHLNRRVELLILSH